MEGIQERGAVSFKGRTKEIVFEKQPTSGILLSEFSFGGSAYIRFQPPVYLLFSLKWWWQDQGSRIEGSSCFTFIIEREPTRISGENVLDSSSKWKFSLKTIYSRYRLAVFLLRMIQDGLPVFYRIKCKISTTYIVVNIYCVSNAKHFTYISTFNSQNHQFYKEIADSKSLDVKPCLQPH